MKFKPAPEDACTMMFNRLVSENELVEIGCFRVGYGWRVRAGFVGDPCVFLDWCAGANWKDVERLYSLCFAVLSNREENRECFNGLPPYSKIKPFFLDLDFVEVVGKEAGDFTLMKLSGTQPVSLQNSFI